MSQPVAEVERMLVTAVREGSVECLDTAFHYISHVFNDAVWTRYLDTPSSSVASIVTCCEVALRLQKWDIANRCVQWLFYCDYPTQELRIRALFCDAAVSAHNSSAGVDGDALRTATAEAMKKVVFGIKLTLALDPSLQPRLIETGVKSIWNAVRELYRLGNYNAIADVVGFAVIVLDRQKSTLRPQTRITWLLRYATCLAGSDRGPEAIAHLTRASELASATQQMTLVHQINRMQAVLSKTVPVTSSASGVGGGGRSGGGNRLDSRKNYGQLPPPGVVTVSPAAWSAIHAAQLFFSGAVDVSVAESELRHALDEILVSRGTMAGGSGTGPTGAARAHASPRKASQGGRTRGRKATSAPSAAAGTAGGTLGIAQLDRNREDEALAELVIALALAGNGYFNPIALKAIANGKSIAVRVLGEYAQAIVKAHGGHAFDEIYSVTDTSTLTQAKVATLRQVVQHLDRAISTASNIPDLRDRQFITQIGCVLLWNLSLPLLQPGLREYVYPSMSRAAQKLFAMSSNLNRLYFLMELECSSMDMASNRAEATLSRLSQIASIEYTGYVEDPHRIGSIAAVGMQVQWLRKRARARQSRMVDSAVAPPEEHALQYLEQTWLATAAQRKSLLSKALELLSTAAKALNSSAVPTTTTAPRNSAAANNTTGDSSASHGHQLRQGSRVAGKPQQQQQQQQQPVLPSVDGASAGPRGGSVGGGRRLARTSSNVRSWHSQATALGGSVEGLLTRTRLVAMLLDHALGIAWRDRQEDAIPIVRAAGTLLTSQFRWSEKEERVLIHQQAAAYFMIAETYVVEMERRGLRMGMPLSSLVATGAAPLGGGRPRQGGSQSQTAADAIETEGRGRNRGRDNAAAAQFNASPGDLAAKPGPLAGVRHHDREESLTGDLTAVVLDYEEKVCTLLVQAANLSTVLRQLGVDDRWIAMNAATVMWSLYADAFNKQCNYIRALKPLRELYTVLKRVAPQLLSREDEQLAKDIAYAYVMALLQSFIAHCKRATLTKASALEDVDPARVERWVTETDIFAFCADMSLLQATVAGGSGAGVTAQGRRLKSVSSTVASNAPSPLAASQSTSSSAVPGGAHNTNVGMGGGNTAKNGTLQLTAILSKAADVCSTMISLLPNAMAAKDFCLLSACIARLNEISGSTKNVVGSSWPGAECRPSGLQCQYRVLYTIGQLEYLTLSPTEIQGPRCAAAVEQALQWLIQQPNVELCGRLSLLLNRLPNHEARVLRVCGIADALYDQGKLGWKQTPVEPTEDVRTSSKPSAQSVQAVPGRGRGAAAKRSSHGVGTMEGPSAASNPADGDATSPSSQGKKPTGDANGSHSLKFGSDSSDNSSSEDSSEEEGSGTSSSFSSSGSGFENGEANQSRLRRMKQASQQLPPHAIPTREDWFWYAKALQCKARATLENINPAIQDVFTQLEMRIDALVALTNSAVAAARAPASQQLQTILEAYQAYRGSAAPLAREASKRSWLLPSLRVMLSPIVYNVVRGIFRSSNSSNSGTRAGNGKKVGGATASHSMAASSLASTGRTAQVAISESLELWLLLISCLIDSGAYGEAFDIVSTLLSHYPTKCHQSLLALDVQCRCQLKQPLNRVLARGREYDKRTQASIWMKVALYSESVQEQQKAFLAAIELLEYEHPSDRAAALLAYAQWQLERCPNSMPISALDDVISTLESAVIAAVPFVPFPHEQQLLGSHLCESQSGTAYTRRGRHRVSLTRDASEQQACSAVIEAPFLSFDVAIRALFLLYRVAPFGMRTASSNGERRPTSPRATPSVVQESQESRSTARYAVTDSLSLAPFPTVSQYLLVMVRCVEHLWALLVGVINKNSTLRAEKESEITWETGHGPVHSPATGVTKSVAGGKHPQLPSISAAQVKRGAKGASNSAERKAQPSPRRAKMGTTEWDGRASPQSPSGGDGAHTSDGAHLLTLPTSHEEWIGFSLTRTQLDALRESDTPLVPRVGGGTHDIGGLVDTLLEAGRAIAINSEAEHIAAPLLALVELLLKTNTVSSDETFRENALMLCALQMGDIALRCRLGKSTTSCETPPTVALYLHNLTTAVPTDSSRRDLADRCLGAAGSERDRSASSEESHPLTCAARCNVVRSHRYVYPYWIEKAALLLSAGELSDASELLQMAYDFAQMHNDRNTLVYCGCLQAEIHLLVGQPTEARQCLRASLKCTTIAGAEGRSGSIGPTASLLPLTSPLTTPISADLIARVMLLELECLLKEGRESDAFDMAAAFDIQLKERQQPEQKNGDVQVGGNPLAAWTSASYATISAVVASGFIGTVFHYREERRRVTVGFPTRAAFGAFSYTSTEVDSLGTTPNWNGTEMSGKHQLINSVLSREVSDYRVQEALERVANQCASCGPSAAGAHDALILLQCLQLCGKWSCQLSFRWSAFAAGATATPGESADKNVRTVRRTPAGLLTYLTIEDHAAHKRVRILSSAVDALIPAASMDGFVDRSGAGSLCRPQVCLQLGIALLLRGRLALERLGVRDDMLQTARDQPALLLRIPEGHHAELQHHVVAFMRAARRQQEAEARAKAAGSFCSSHAGESNHAAPPLLQEHDQRLEHLNRQETADGAEVVAGESLEGRQRTNSREQRDVKEAPPAGAISKREGEKVLPETGASNEQALRTSGKTRRKTGARRASSSGTANTKEESGSRSGASRQRSTSPQSRKSAVPFEGSTSRSHELDDDSSRIPSARGSGGAVPEGARTSVMLPPLSMGETTDAPGMDWSDFSLDAAADTQFDDEIRDALEAFGVSQEVAIDVTTLSLEKALKTFQRAEKMLQGDAMLLSVLYLEWASAALHCAKQYATALEHRKAAREKRPIPSLLTCTTLQEKWEASIVLPEYVLQTHRSQRGRGGTSADRSKRDTPSKRSNLRASGSKRRDNTTALAGDGGRPTELYSAQRQALAASKLSPIAQLYDSAIAYAVDCLDYNALSSALVGYASCCALADCSEIGSRAVEKAVAARTCGYIVQVWRALAPQRSTEQLLYAALEKMRRDAPHNVSSPLFGRTVEHLRQVSPLFRTVVPSSWLSDSTDEGHDAVDPFKVLLDLNICVVSIVAAVQDGHIYVVVRRPDGLSHSRRVCIAPDVIEMCTVVWLRYCEDRAVDLGASGGQQVVGASKDKASSSQGDETKAAVQYHNALQQIESALHGLWVDFEPLLLTLAKQQQQPQSNKQQQEQQQNQQTCRLVLCLDPIFQPLPLERLSPFTSFRSTHREISLPHLLKKLNQLGSERPANPTRALVIADVLHESPGSPSSLHEAAGLVKNLVLQLECPVADSNGLVRLPDTSFALRKLSSSTMLCPGMTESPTTPSAQQQQQQPQQPDVLLTTLCGALPNSLPLPSIAGLNFSRLRVAGVFDKGTNALSARREKKQDIHKSALHRWLEQPHNIALLLLARGVNMVMIHSHAVETQRNDELSQQFLQTVCGGSCWGIVGSTGGSGGGGVNMSSAAQSSGSNSTVTSVSASGAVQPCRGFVEYIDRIHNDVRELQLTLRSSNAIDAPEATASDMRCDCRKLISIASLIIWGISSDFLKTPKST